MKTGFYSFETYKHGVCPCNTGDDAISAATKAAHRVREQVIVYTPTGDVLTVVGTKYPTPEQRMIGLPKPIDENGYDQASITIDDDTPVEVILASEICIGSPVAEHLADVLKRASTTRQCRVVTGYNPNTRTVGIVHAPESEEKPPHA